MSSEQDDVDAAVACADLVDRAGARGFEIGYLNEPDDPAFEKDGPRWYAHAQYRGHRMIAEGYSTATGAANALAARILTGGRCRCGKLVALSDDGAVFVSGNMADGSTWTPEEAAAAGQCRWKRVGQRWEPGCDVPSIHVTGGRF